MSQHPDAPSAPDPGTAPADPPESTAPQPGWLPVTRPPARHRQRPDGSDGQADSAGSSEPPTPPATDADDRQLFKDKASTFSALAGAGLAAIGGLLNYAAGAGTEAFLPDEDDMGTIPPPVGRIVARRVKMSEDANLSDTGDMIAAGIGLAAWLAKSLLIVVDARTAARRKAAGVEHQADEPAPPGPVIPGQVMHDAGLP